MFLKQSFAQEIRQNLELELNDEYVSSRKKAQAMDEIAKAANLLDYAGFNKQANALTAILEKLAWNVPSSDPATSGLTPEKMESNLKEKGWVFNANDGQILDVVDPGTEKVEELIVDEIEQPQDTNEEATAIE